MIKTCGEDVYSAEVENALAQHPAVSASAVIGIPSEQWGEAVHAVVVRKPGHDVSATESMTHCKTLIAGYKSPLGIDFMDAQLLSGGRQGSQDQAARKILARPRSRRGISQATASFLPFELQE